MVSRQKRLERAQLAVLFNVPFFAPGACKLPVVWDDSVPTACTDGKQIRWNGAWFDKLPDAVLPTVLCHEVQHCLLGHVWRAPGQCDWPVWNQATDHAVNLGLKEFSELVMGRMLSDPFPFPEPAGDYCADTRFAGMAEEAIYGVLSKAPKPQPQKAGNKPGQGQGSGQSGPGSMPSFGDIEQPKPEPADQAAGKKLASDWRNTLIQSASMCQGRGTLPGGIERLVSELVNPTVPWWELLRNWLREQCADDWNWLEPAMEYEGSGFILPSLKSEKIGPMVFATDTSGSIDQAMLAQFQTEKQNCLNELRPSSLVDIYCDTAINAVVEYSSGDTIQCNVQAGGGTDFRPVFEHVRGMRSTPKALVYLTDLDGSFPDEDPGYPVLWVTWNQAKAPFGETVYAKQG